MDQSWCARINAFRRSPAPSPPPPPSAWPFVEMKPPAHHLCECCGSGMFDHSCKIVCPNCGYRRDCSDP